MSPSVRKLADSGPRRGVIDDSMHAAVVPLGSQLRIAGTAQFAGFDRGISAARIDNLLELLRAVCPAIHARLEPRSFSPCAGFRPMSVDSVPIMGATPLRNVSLNTGHGHLGWTMAAGSGRVVADLIVGARPQIDIGDYELSQFRRWNAIDSRARVIRRNLITDMPLAGEEAAAVEQVTISPNDPI